MASKLNTTLFENSLLAVNYSLISERTGAHSYGFNGQEKDDEVSGAGNSMSSSFWQYDTRLGRRWNIDPVIKHHESSYSAFSNNPIIFVDPEGNTDYYSARGNWIGTDGIDNGKKQMVLTNSTESVIREATKNGNNIGMNEYVYHDIVDVPSSGVIKAFDNAYKTAETNFKETSVVVGVDKDGQPLTSIKEGEAGKTPTGSAYGEVVDEKGGVVDYDAHTWKKSNNFIPFAKQAKTKPC